MSNACQKCRFWLKGEGEMGTCRLHPPVIVAGASQAAGSPVRGLWPETAPDEFCFEWKKKDDW